MSLLGPDSFHFYAITFHQAEGLVSLQHSHLRSLAITGVTARDKPTRVSNQPLWTILFFTSAGDRRDIRPIPPSMSRWYLVFLPCFRSRLGSVRVPISTAGLPKALVSRRGKENSSRKRGDCSLVRLVLSRTDIFCHWWNTRPAARHSHGTLRVKTQYQAVWYDWCAVLGWRQQQAQSIVADSVVLTEPTSVNYALDTIQMDLIFVKGDSGRRASSVGQIHMKTSPVVADSSISPTYLFFFYRRVCLSSGLPESQLPNARARNQKYIIHRPDSFRYFPSPSL